MKKALLLAAVALVATNANASKARRTALNNAAHLNDIQDVVAVNKPDKAVAYGEWATLEFGSTPANTNPATAYPAANAEGGFVRMMGNSAFGAYLGAPNTTANAYRTAFNRVIGAGTDTGATLLMETPLRLFYASKVDSMNWGVGLLYSTSKKTNSTVDDKKQDASGLIASASTDVWDAQLSVGISNNTTQTVAAGDNKLTGKTTAILSGGWKFDTMYAYAAYGMGGATGTLASGSTANLDRSDSNYKLGLIDSHKKDGTEFFYGVEYAYSNATENASVTNANSSLGGNFSKKETTSVPIFVGVEAEAASWLVLRGSISQTLGALGLAKVKNTAGSGGTDTSTTGADDTTVAAGAGIKWNKFTFDGVLAASKSATGTFGLNGPDFLTNASLTYMF